jgi:hypothetical protein
MLVAGTSVDDPEQSSRANFCWGAQHTPFFVVAHGTIKGDPCVYVDLYRVEDAKIAEHWGFDERVPPRKEWKNTNGLL